MCNRVAYSLLCAVLFVGSAHAQKTSVEYYRQNQYTDAIAAITQNKAELPALSARDWVVLSAAHLERAYLMQRLWALQAELGAAYHKDRETDPSAVKTAWNTYFLGRYLFEVEDYEGAREYLQAAAKKQSLPAAYHQRAQIWLGAVEARQGRTGQARSTWNMVSVSQHAGLAGELAYARWRVGLADTPGACSGGASTNLVVLRCKLWMALRTGRTADLRAAQQQLMQRSGPNLPDIKHPVRTDFTLRFYDPATLHMLALADFALAADALGHVDDENAPFKAGASAYEAGLFDQAAQHLARTNDARKAIYLGGIAYQNGDQDEANRLWDQGRASGKTASLEWAAVASHFAAERKAVRDYFWKNHRRSPPSDREEAFQLGRALLYAGRDEDAWRSMHTAYARPSRNTAGPVRPKLSAAMAHAKFKLGPPFYSEVLGHLVSLLESYPMAGSVYDQSQGYMVPESRGGDVRSGGH